ncbi:MAG: Fur family transcriptional regulator [Pseudomonadota bacterium]
MAEKSSSGRRRASDSEAAASPVAASPASESSFAPHDHDQCRVTAIAEVERLCAERGLRLTPVRRRALELLWESHRPLGAYAMIERLSAEGWNAYPPTVYRALDFLVTNGFAHKLHGANAFVGCTAPDAQHAPQFLICTECEEMREVVDEGVQAELRRALSERGFMATRLSLEIEGVCAPCRAGATPAGERLS